MGRSGQEKAEDKYRACRLVPDMAGRPRRGLRNGPRHPGVEFRSVPEPLQVGGTLAGSGPLLLLTASPVVPARPQWSPCRARASAWSGSVFLEKLHREDGPLSATCPAALGSALRSPHCRPIPRPLGHLTLSSVPHCWGPGSPRRCDPSWDLAVQIGGGRQASLSPL